MNKYSFTYGNDITKLVDDKSNDITNPINNLEESKSPRKHRDKKRIHKSKVMKNKAKNNPEDEKSPEKNKKSGKAHS